MKQLKLAQSEYRFLKIIWEREPITSKNLVLECEKELGWKKSTTYTVLKRLIEKDILENINSLITSKIKADEVMKKESRDIVNSNFNGSLPKFIAAFMGEEKLSKDEAEKLKKLIDEYKEK